MSSVDDVTPAGEPGREPERYELSEPPRYRFDFTRRSFLEFVGMGVLLTTARSVAVAQGGRGVSPGRSVGARLHVEEDGTVTVFTSKVEVGQGSRTQLTQAAAEELRLPLDAVRLVMADTGSVPVDGGTFGSLTTPRTVPAVRRAAAAAREILRELAAQRWKAAAGDLQVADGSVVHPATRETLTYADLARSEDVAKALDQAVSADVSLRGVKEWQVLGTPARKPGGVDIVTGAHRYPSDITRPGMVYGKVLRPPSYGATLTAVDVSAAQAMKGVTVVRDKDFVGATAASSHEARKAVSLLAATASWEPREHPSSGELFEHLKEHAHTDPEGPRPPRVKTRGTPEEVLRQAHQTLTARYEVPYIQHVPMEPRAAVAEWREGRLTVWTGTQRPHGVRAELMRAFKLDGEKVRVIVPDPGGGFGGKHTGECAVEAARLARAAARPVCLRWSREEEFTWAYFRPAGVLEVAAGLDRAGNLVAWDFTNINSGASALESPYRIPHTKSSFLYCDSPLREGSYRGLAATANTFARECFMDELAAAAGKDPLEFRLAHLENPRLRAVLERAAAAFDWKRRTLSSRAALSSRARGGDPSASSRRAPVRGVGLACGTEKGSYTAACVEVDVDPQTGQVRVHEVYQAFECGAVQNPGNLQSQVEGSILMGLGGALREEIQFANGRVTNPRLSQYRVPRFADVPRIETLLVDRPDLPSVGAGETPIIAIAPAIANGVYRATGARCRSLPIRPPGQG